MCANKLSDYGSFHVSNLYIIITFFSTPAMKTEEDGGGKLKLRNFLRLTMELRGRAKAEEAHRKEKKRNRDNNRLLRRCVRLTRSVYYFITSEYR